MAYKLLLCPLQSLRFQIQSWVGFPEMMSLQDISAPQYCWSISTSIKAESVHFESDQWPSKLLGPQGGWHLTSNDEMHRVFFHGFRHKVEQRVADLWSSTAAFLHCSNLFQWKAKSTPTCRLDHASIPPHLRTFFRCVPLFVYPKDMHLSSELNCLQNFFMHSKKSCVRVMCESLLAWPFVVWKPFRFERHSSLTSRQAPLIRFETSFCTEISCRKAFRKHWGSLLSVCEAVMQLDVWIAFSSGSDICTSKLYCSKLQNSTGPSLTHWGEEPGEASHIAGQLGQKALGQLSFVLETYEKTLQNE